jgi:orotidine-5'-phosphate decarboxylase/adenine/guanine phosphoribosyltransferase-like PRPP-binding protein
MKKQVVILPLDGYKTAEDLFSKLVELANSSDMADLLAYIKVNDGVHNPDAGGPRIVKELKNILESSGLESVGIFLDLKIYDVSTTVINTIKKYSECLPTILTVSAFCSVEVVTKLRKTFPQVKLAMVSVPTDISDDECRSRYGQLPEVKIYSDLINIREIYKSQQSTLESSGAKEPFDLVVCSPWEVPFLKKNLPDGYEFIVPGIRDEWMKKAGEPQKRIAGINQALEAGATFVVMGAQITQGNPELEISPEESRRLTRLEVEKYYEKYKKKEVDFLKLLKDCDGYYESPKSENGKYLGPLVAYAGTYKSITGRQKNKVGFKYFNFARGEADSRVRGVFADKISQAIIKFSESGKTCQAVLGAPMGGILLAGSIAERLSCRVAFAEKKILSLADPGSGIKEKSEQVIDRHEINFGENVFVIEDVCNNFSTTEKLKAEIEKASGNLIGIACAINRSGQTEWNGIPVISALFIPTEQYEQEDPEVVDLIAQEKIVWKPKQEWAKLKSAMQ